ncbi:MAG: hypothetical protein GY856_02000 [bacterium]|nr:hypothetical protein [bacterium]
MEKLRIANPLLAAFGLVCLLVFVAPGSALADDEHVVTVKLEFTGASCSDTTVAMTAASCDGDDIADKFESELDDMGSPFAICTWVPTPQEWQCAFVEPSGCDQVDIEVSVELGTDCNTDKASIEINGATYNYWAWDFE